MDENLIVRIDKKTARRLTFHARRMKVTRAELVRQAVDRFMDMVEFEQLNTQGGAMARRRYSIHNEEDVDRRLSTKQS